MYEVWCKDPHSSRLPQLWTSHLPVPAYFSCHHFHCSGSYYECCCRRSGISAGLVRQRPVSGSCCCLFRCVCWFRATSPVSTWFPFSCPVHSLLFSPQLKLVNWQSSLTKSSVCRSLASICPCLLLRSWFQLRFPSGLRLLFWVSLPGTVFYSKFFQC